jgi:hypothetical protein
MDTIGVILVIVVYAVLMGMALVANRVEIPPESGDDDYEDWEGKF